jgi:uncharacterized membrane protein YfcA
MTDVSLLDAALLLLTGATAGWIGVLVGIGGGVVVVPVLFVGLGVDFRVAVATALVGVLATSVTAGTVHAASGVGNLRLGVVLELATTIGAVVGGLVATLLATSVLSGIFAVVAAATSNFMVGLTAAASIFVYFAAGYVVPLIAAPVAIGVVAGSIAGALRARLSHPDRIRALLATILVLVAIEMALRAGGIGVI